MTTYTDFRNGLEGPDQYLSAQNPIKVDLQGSAADIGRFVFQADWSMSLKEIICSLLAGRGLKLPNIQLCVFLNLQELLGIPQLQAALREVLSALADAMQRFLDHTRIGEVLGRINSVLSEITSIANMINFCSAPIDPVAIPNLLEQAMQSFLGAGEDIINKIGQLIPGEIGGCLTPGGFNCTAFSGGILGKLCDNPDVFNGTASEDFINSIRRDVDDVTSDIDVLIAIENNLSGLYDQGGSDFSLEPREVNTGIGVLHNSQDEGIQGNTQIAGQLKALYDSLGSYQVEDNKRNVYNNIFETFVEPDLMRLLRREDDPRPTISERQPVYNYCGEVVGYTEAVSQSQPNTSEGLFPGEINQPGFNAGGLTSSTSNADDNNNDSDDAVTNIITSNTTRIADSESAMLALDLPSGTLIYRTDTGETFIRENETDSGITDYRKVSSDERSEFLQDVNDNDGFGVIIRNGSEALYRNISGTPSQINILNSDGIAGNPTLSLADDADLPGSGGVILPKGSTAQRNDADGSIRYNTQLDQFEGRTAGNWGPIASTNEFRETVQTTGDGLTTVPFVGITPAADHAWFVEVRATAKRTNGVGVASIKREGIIDNTSGVVTLVIDTDSIVVTSVGAVGNDSTSSPEAQAYDLVLDTPSNTEFEVSVQGDVGHDVNWNVKITYHAVAG